MPLAVAHRRSGPWVWKGGMGRAPALCGAAGLLCLGFQWLFWSLISRLLSLLLHTGGAVLGTQWLLLLRMRGWEGPWRCCPPGSSPAQ